MYLHGDRWVAYGTDGRQPTAPSYDEAEHGRVELAVKGCHSGQTDAATPHNCKSECGEIAADATDARMYNNNRIKVHLRLALQYTPILGLQPHE